jgi:hypothetical protein
VGGEDLLNQTTTSAFGGNKRSTFQQINDFFSGNDHINAYNQILGYDIQNPKKALFSNQSFNKEEKRGKRSMY